MSSDAVIKCKGLYPSPNQLSEVPEGALVEATNCVVQYPGVLESRRGQQRQSYSFGGSSARGKEGFFYGENLFVHQATTLERDTGTAFASVSGSYSGPDETLLRMKAVEAAQNCYFTTSTGIYGMDSATATPALAGVPPGIQLYGYTSQPVGAARVMPYNSQAAYRVVWGIKDANGNVKLGAPSERMVLRNHLHAAIGGLVRNANVTTVTLSSPLPGGVLAGQQFSLTPGEANFPAGTVTVGTAISETSFSYTDVAANATSTVAQDFSAATCPALQVYVPPGITSSHFCRLYRTEFTDAASIPASDECFQIAERTATALEISTGYMAFFDQTPDDMLGPPGYWNPNSGDGLGASRYRPPIANDVCHWDDRTWYFNTTEPHRLTLSMLGVGATQGVQNNDTLAVAGRTYTFKTTAAGAEEVGINSAGGSSDAGYNVQQTARELVRKINSNPSNTLVTAYYVSSATDAPGRILLEARSLGASAFTALASRPASWYPDLTSATSSTADERPNGASFSDPGQPEAVRLTSWLPVGPKSKQILRGIALRDKIIVATEAGFWTISGSYPYRVDPLDDTVRLVGPDTAVKHSNQVCCLTSQGVASISDTGVRILSVPIEEDILGLFGASMDAVKRYAFGVSYESDRQYQLWLPEESTDTTCKQAWVFNSLHETWTRWEGDRSWGRVHSEADRLYLGDGAANTCRVERKDYARSDYADESFAVSVYTYSGTSVRLTTVAGITVGDMLWQSDSVKALVTAIDNSTATLTVSSTEAWSLGAASCFVAIECAAKWTPHYAGAPGLVKHWRDASFHFRRFYVNDFAARFDTEVSPVEAEVPLSSPGFGLTAFGGSSFGFEIGPTNRRASVPQNHQRSTQLRVGLTIREAQAIWALNGYTLTYEVEGERNSR